CPQDEDEDGDPSNRGEEDLESDVNEDESVEEGEEETDSVGEQSSSEGEDKVFDKMPKLISTAKASSPAVNKPRPHQVTDKIAGVLPIEGKSLPLCFGSNQVGEKGDPPDLARKVFDNVPQVQYHHPLRSG
ncbi:hypothetical protein U1Q18_000430, partial [Sarracenia purpurea var. burkii]